MRILPESEALVRKAWARVSREAKLAFFGAFSLGLLVHLYMLVNKLPNHDDILGLFIKNDSTNYGRWFLAIPSALSTTFSMPWVTGLLALLWLSLSVVCVVKLLDVKKTFQILLIATVMVCFPTVCYTLCYMFTADAYMFALLLSALGAYLADKRGLGFLFGGVCIGLSLATYQAYAFFSLGLIAIRMLLYMLFDAEAEGKAILKRLLQYAAAFAVAAILYRIGLSVSLAAKNVTLKTYMGLDGIASISFREVFSRIPLAYDGFLAVCKGESELLPGRWNALAFSLTAAAVVSISVAAIIRARGPQKPLKVILSIGALCLLPLCCNGIVLLSKAGLHLLMLYPVCLLYISAIALYDRISVSPGVCEAVEVTGTRAATFAANCRVLCGYLLALCIAANTCLWALDANQTYLALELKFDNMLSLATRMVDRVEQLPEYVADETPVWYTGTLSDANYGAVKSDVFARASATDMTGREWNYTALMNNMYFSAFVKNYVGVTFVLPEDADAEAAMETDEYKAMPYFPYAGSVRCIDGIIIINGGPNPQSPP